MVGGIPVHYRGGGENVVASYDYSDIAEGTGIKAFYALVVTGAGGANANILSDEPLYSLVIQYALADVSITTEAYVAYVDESFNLSPFNLPKIVNGTAYLTWTSTNQANTDPDQLGYWEIIISKVSGLDVTTVGSVTDTAASTSRSLHLQTFKIPLTKTHFKKDDILRLTIKGWAKCTETPDTHTRNFYFGTDPQNRDGANIKPSTDDPVTTTVTKLYIPFALDL